MPLTLVYCYIIIGICCLLFLNYKFLKIFFSSKVTALKQTEGVDAPAGVSVSKDVWSIPGPMRVPIFGTKWIYLWKYKMSKIHEVYGGW